VVAAREAAIWELEEQHLKDKAQLARRQLRDLYFLKRHQMITRHEKVSHGLANYTGVQRGLPYGYDH